MEKFSEPMTHPQMCGIHGAFMSKGFKIFSNVTWTTCPTCQEIESAEQQKRTDELAVSAKQKMVEDKLQRTGIPLRYRDRMFLNFEVSTDLQAKALSTASLFAESFSEHRKKGTMMVFSGLPGTGKSHLATAIAKHVMTAHTAFYTSAIDAIRMIRDTWRRDSMKTETQILNMLAGIDLLILDEIGVQYGTEAEQVSLFDIIDKRYRDMMPTILITNLDKAKMKLFLGDRSFDRLREGGIWLTFDWASKRGSV